MTVDRDPTYARRLEGSWFTSCRQSERFASARDGPEVGDQRVVHPHGICSSIDHQPASTYKFARENQFDITRLLEISPPRLAVGRTRKDPHRPSVTRILNNQLARSVRQPTLVPDDCQMSTPTRSHSPLQHKPKDRVRDPVRHPEPATTRTGHARSPTDPTSRITILHEPPPAPNTHQRPPRSQADDRAERHLCTWERVTSLTRRIRRRSTPRTRRRRTAPRSPSGKVRPHR